MTSAVVTVDARPRPNGGRAGLVARYAWAELRSSLRNPEFAVGAVAIPVILYGIFGLPDGQREFAPGVSVSMVMMVSMSAYGIVSLAIFSFGEQVAKDRGRGWTRALEITPITTGVQLLGRTIVGMAHGALIVGAMALLAATVGGVALDAAQWAAFAAVMVSGVVVLSPLGYAIAYLARPRAAAVIANVVFLPLSFVSGFFFPLSELPPVLQDVAAFLPTFHFGQIAYRTVMSDAAVTDWTGIPTAPLAVDVAWVVGAAVLLAGLALVAARREAATRRG